jgi:hypothetical protein
MLLYRPQIDVVMLNPDGFRMPLPTTDVDVYNVTQAAAIDTLTTDTNGVLAEGSWSDAGFPVADGDIIELTALVGGPITFLGDPVTFLGSPATFGGSSSLTARLTLRSTQLLAYEHSDNDLASYVAVNEYGDTDAPTKLDIYYKDLDVADAAPVFVQSIPAPTGPASFDIPFQSTVDKNVRWFAVPRTAKAARTESVTSAPTGFDLAIPGTGAAVLKGTATLNFGSVPAHAAATLTMTITGVAVGDVATVSVQPRTATPEAGIVYDAYISAADTVTVRANNYTTAAIDPANTDFMVTVVYL